MSLKERIDATSYLDSDGDVMPFADISDELDSIPVSNASIAQGIANLDAYRAEHAREERLLSLAEAEARLAREQATIDAGLENPGVYTTLQQRYQNELDLMNIVSGSNQRGGKDPKVPGGFETAHRTEESIHERYGDQLPQVAIGAKKNLLRMINQDVLDVYQANELIAAGVGDKEEIIFDARTVMRNKYKGRYYSTTDEGQIEKDKLRRDRRSFLNKKLAEYASK